MSIPEKFKKTKYHGGEMLPYERFKIFNWIKEYKPKNILEIGCGTCGGSTKFMSDALNDINGGNIYCCDPSRGPSETFLSRHENVKYFKETSDFLIDKIINENIEIDFAFFDGPENPDIAMNDIKKLEPYIKNGTYFSMHDWHFGARNYDGASSSKSDKIKPYIENSEPWEEIEVLLANKKNNKTGLEEVDSVGLCLYKYKK